MTTKKIGRNDPCPCGSGEKHKKCCLIRQERHLTQVDINNSYTLLRAKREPEPHLHIVPSIVHKGYRWRSIWSTLHYRPLAETFHEFIRSILLTSTFGEDWRKNQMALIPEERHILIQWVESYEDWKRANQTDENKEGDSEVWGAIPTGEVQALSSLAYDTYCLQIVNRLPDFLIKRLKDRQQFQGVRYEIAVAAIIARAGFEITFLDDVVKDQMHCEFIAKQKGTGIEIGVEAKSRHRTGVLHEKGEFDYTDDVRGDVRRLFKKARSQKPENIPYIIFIDLNLPSTPNVPLNKKPWFDDINKMLDKYGTPSAENLDPFNALFLTNFSYHYGGNEGIAPQGEFSVYLSQFPEFPLNEPQVLNEIWESLRRYSYIPKEV